MKNRFASFCAALVLAFLVLGIFMVATDSASAQTSSRRRRTRSTKPVVTNPPIAPPDEEQSGEPKVVRTADESAPEAEPESTPAAKTQSKKKTPPPDDKAEMKDTIDALSNQVERLSDKLSQMQENDKTLLEMERLTRAEQRAESLRTQLVDVESRLADLQAKLEQLEYSLKPENIERSTQGYGTTRPEEARDMRRRQLENDRTRTLSQIRILETSKQRLESSLVLADSEVDRLRRRLEQTEQQEATKAATVPASNEKP